MYGDKILARSISAPRVRDKHKNLWQYHSRSDAHSKVICWAIVFDLLHSCDLFREHVSAGRITFGINHRMYDFQMNRSKDLDLVVGKPTGSAGAHGVSLGTMRDRYGIQLNEVESAVFNALPELISLEVGTVLLALEAKACMTEHVKAKPRLYDELSSSHQAIHGDSKSAIAAGLVAINVADTFVSPDRNKKKLTKRSKIEVSKHSQPHAAKEVLAKVKELPRRSSEEGVGYDALGVVLLDCKNDGSPIKIVELLTDGSAVDSILTYDTLISRIASTYTSRARNWFNESGH